MWQLKADFTICLVSQYSVLFCFLIIEHKLIADLQGVISGLHVFDAREIHYDEIWNESLGMINDVHFLLGYICIINCTELTP